MRQIEWTTQFKRDYKREKRTDARLDELLMPVMTLLLGDDELPERMRDHPLQGEWKDYRDCHVKPDLVLIYAKTVSMLTLVRLGSHSELFG